MPVPTVPTQDPVADSRGATTPSWLRLFSFLGKVFSGNWVNVQEFAGDGTPEGVVAASRGSTYRRRDGGAGTTFYVKESGTGNIGWVAK